MGHYKQLIEEFASTYNLSLRDFNAKDGVLQITLNERTPLLEPQMPYWKTCPDRKREASENATQGSRRQRTTTSPLMNFKRLTEGELMLNDLIPQILQDSMARDEIAPNQWAYLMNTSTRTVYNWRKSTKQSQNLKLSKGTINQFVQMAMYYKDKQKAPIFLSKEGQRALYLASLQIIGVYSLYVEN